MRLIQNVRRIEMTQKRIKIGVLWGVMQAIVVAWFAQGGFVSGWCRFSPFWFALIAGALAPEIVGLFRLRLMFSVPLVAFIISAASMLTLAIPVMIIAIATEGLTAGFAAPWTMFAVYFIWSAFMIPPFLAICASAGTFLIVRDIVPRADAHRDASTQLCTASDSVDPW